MTSKELVLATLEGQNPPRIPRQLWTLPWAKMNYPRELEKIQNDFPDDILNCPSFLTESSPIAQGDPYSIGESTDEWGCQFTNLHAGVIGEVKHAIVTEEEWEDVSNVHLPVDNLSVGIETVNSFCRENKDKFIIAAACPRPFERLQFIRGTEQLYIDLIMQPERMLSFIKAMHEFYCEELMIWAKTDVDALPFMDDWGAQQSLLINPSLWVEMFKPLYKDYIDIAHSHGKKAFMHSDGYILDIYPHLIELGLDAVNSQIFCMDAKTLAPFKGKITFWGEMDRQHLLPSGSPTDILGAVENTYHQLYHHGGCIAQCEFGPGAKPENVYAVFESWNLVHKK